MEIDRRRLLVLTGGLLASLAAAPNNQENFYSSANGKMSVPWGPYFWNSLSGYSIRDGNGFLAKLHRATLNLGLPSPDPIAHIDQHIRDINEELKKKEGIALENHPVRFEIGLCPGVPRAAILAPEINVPITIAGVPFSVFDRRGVALYRFFAAAIKRDEKGQAIDWGTSANPFAASEFHYLNMALYEQGIPYGLNTKEDHDLQPWWRPAYKTAVERRGNNWRGWVEVADYISPGQGGALKTMERGFEYELDPDNPLDPGRWIRRDRIWAGFQVDPDPNRIHSPYQWQRESFNREVAELIIGVRSGL